MNKRPLVICTDPGIDDFIALCMLLNRPEFDILAAFPQERAVVLGVYDGALSPGSTIEVYGTSRRVERVLYHFDPDGFAAEVWHR